VHDRRILFRDEIQPQRVVPLPPPLSTFTKVLALNPISGDMRQNEAPRRRAGMRA
jgi:hypothetical protein